MKFRKGVAALLAASMAASPVMAQSAAPVATTVRAGAELGEASELRGGFIIPMIAIVAIILGIYAATHDDDDDLPHSP
jgi:Ca2+/Na+ antiporter